MKIYVFLAPTFSAEEVFKWARHGAETEQPMDAGKVCQDPRVKYPKAREFECTHTFASTDTHAGT